MSLVSGAVRIDARLAIVASAILAATVGFSQEPILWTTYLGGRFNDDPTAIAVGPDGSVYVGGVTQSDDFPTTANALRTIPPRTEQRGGRIRRLRKTIPSQQLGFVARINSSGSTLLYGSYIGGSGRNAIQALAVDSRGNLFIGGTTDTDDFPTTDGAAQQSIGGTAKAHWNDPGDGFVVGLRSDGSALFSTYVGGSGSDTVATVATDAQGFVYVAGSTNSARFPGQHTAIGPVDGFAIKLEPTSGKLVYAQRIGNGGQTTPTSLAVTGNGQAFIGGSVEDSVGSKDAFLAELDRNGEVVEFLTFGGSDEDSAAAVRLDSSSADGALGVVFGGRTKSRDLKTSVGVYQPRYPGGSTNGFISKVAPKGSASFTTYLGKDWWDHLDDLAVDAKGRIHAIGTVEARSSFPISERTAMPPIDSVSQIYYAVLDGRGRQLEFSLRRGGTREGPGSFRVTKMPQIALGPNGSAYVVAMTTDDVSSSSNALQKRSNGGHELIVFRVGATN